MNSDCPYLNDNTRIVDGSDPSVLKRCGFTLNGPQAEAKFGIPACPVEDSDLSGDEDSSSDDDDKVSMSRLHETLNQSTTILTTICRL